MTDKEILNAFSKQRQNEIYKAVIRPKFTMYKELLQVFSFLAIVTAALFMYISFKGVIFAVLLYASLLIFILTQTKNILLLAIYLYQKFAPKIIRAACLFQPSCSEYMRQSIIKYGVFKGVKKGFCRLRRCRPPNGGFDEP